VTHYLGVLIEQLQIQRDRKLTANINKVLLAIALGQVFNSRFTRFFATRREVLFDLCDSP
jgi:hypothetical protein